jgi:SAM domain (Sterile alpha motif)
MGPSSVGLVDTWLTGIGLGYALPAFQTAGVTNATSLSRLELESFDALGVLDVADRKKVRDVG